MAGRRSATWLDAQCVLDLVEEALVRRLRGEIAPERLAKTFDQIPLLGGQLSRNDDVDRHDLVAPIAAVHIGHALSAQPELLAGLGGLRQLECDRSIDGLQLDLVPKDCLGDIDPHLQLNGLALPCEELVRFDTNFDEEVPRLAAGWSRLTLPGKPQGRRFVDTGRNRDRNTPRERHPPLATTSRTRVSDLHAFAIAAGARRRAHELAKDGLLHAADLTGPATRLAFWRLLAVPHARAVATFASLQTGHFDFLLGAKNGFLEFDLDRYLKILPAIADGSATSLRRPAEKSFEDVREGRISEVEGVPTRAAVGGCMTVAVIGRPPIRVGETFVCLVDFLELLFSPVVSIDVGMVFAGKTPIGLAQLVIGRGAADAQNFIVVAFLGHGWSGFRTSIVNGCHRKPLER